MTLSNHDYERAVLGSLIWDNSRIDALAPREDWFTDSRYRRVWRAVSEITARGDVAGVFNTAERSGVPTAEVEDLIGAETVAASAYAVRLRELSRLRRLRTIGQRVTERVGEADADTVLGEIESELLALADDAGGEYRHVVEAVHEAVERAEYAYYRQGKLSGVPTGIGRIDRLTDGLQPSEMIVLAARPGVGKTAASLHVAGTACAAGKRVGFVSLEMPASLLAQRMLSRESGVSGDRLRSGYMTQAGFSQITDAAGRVGEMSLWIVDRPGMVMGDIVTQARRMRRREEIDMLVIDYLGLVRHERQDMPRHEQVADISRRIKSLARELRIPVLALSQITRQSEGHRPTLAALRDSGAIEQDADAVMFLHPTEYNAGDRTKVEAILAKQRNGPVGAVTTVFDAERMRFYEVAGGEDDTG